MSENTIDSAKANADGGSSEARTKPILLDCGVPEEGPSPLFLATHNGQTEAVKHLLDNGTDVNLKDEAGLTCLSLACSLPKEHIEIVQLLLKRGAEVNTCGPGNPPLFSAIMKGHTGVISLLLNSGADVNMLDTVGISPLMLASSRENPLALNEAVAHTLKEKNIPLPMVTNVNCFKVLDILLRHGAKANMQGSGGMSALHGASLAGNTKTVQLLLGYK
jgi:ankyrin repeat protein